EAEGDPAVSVRRLVQIDLDVLVRERGHDGEVDTTVAVEVSPRGACPVRGRHLLQARTSRTCDAGLGGDVGEGSVSTVQKEDVRLLPPVGRCLTGEEEIEPTV